MHIRKEQQEQVENGLGLSIFCIPFKTLYFETDLLHEEMLARLIYIVTLLWLLNEPNYLL